MEPFTLFLLALAAFHTSEFALAALYQPREQLGWHCEPGTVKGDSGGSRDAQAVAVAAAAAAIPPA